ncbi:7140_t:CDS:2 [Entrophospora sp. SA101]|nr:7140_t:CDS:2 [Entrophospora sp. SA101]
MISEEIGGLITNGDNTNDDNTEKIRPVHRKIPVVGKKVDSLTTYHTKLLDLNQSINDLQKNPVTFKKLNSAFIQFNNYIGAQLAATSIRPKNLNDIAAKDVIWDNLNYTKKQLMIKKIVSILAASALALLWFLPVTFLALISKYENLTKILPFLKSGVLPQSITGPIQGIIPPVGLAILMTILPVILRILSKFEGIVTHSRVEISVQRKYFFFLVVNVLLVTALANGVLSALPLILNVGDTVNVLAAKLPAVSTFFLTYVFLSLSGSAMELLQIVPLIVYLISKRFLAKTPRNIYHLEKDMKYVEWGTRFPTHVLMASIGLMSLTTAFYPVILMIILFIITIAALFWMKQIFNVNPRAEFLPADFKGTVDVNTGKLIINQTVNESGSGFGGTHAPIGTKELSTDNGEDDEDDYCNQDFDGLDVVNLDVGGKISTIYLHPAIKSIQPAIWLPKDDNGTSDKEVSDCLNDGIDATNQGASINDKHKVVVNDFSRIPRGSQVDTDEHRVKKSSNYNTTLKQSTNFLANHNYNLMEEETISLCFTITSISISAIGCCILTYHNIIKVTCLRMAWLVGSPGRKLYDGRKHWNTPLYKITIIMIVSLDIIYLSGAILSLEQFNGDPNLPLYMLQCAMWIICGICGFLFTFEPILLNIVAFYNHNKSYSIAGMPTTTKFSDTNDKFIFTKSLNCIDDKSH